MNMWDSIIQFAQDAWIEIVATGGVTAATIKWFIVDKINLAKKELDVINFKAKIQDVSQDVKVVTKVLYDKFEDFQKTVEGYQGKLDNVTKENVMLANLVVETLSVANIPVDAKEKFYAGLINISKINDDVKNTLQIVLDKKKKEQEQNQTVTQDLTNKLDEV